MEGFSSLRVCFSTAGGVSAAHTIYCKRHCVRQSSERTPNDRTLFSLGWPPYASAEDVRKLFLPVGRVSVVYLQSEPGPVLMEEVGEAGFQAGYVVFSAQEEVTDALEMCRSVEVVTCAVEGMGMMKWSRKYALDRPLTSVLEGRVVEGVGGYDRRRGEETELRKRLSEPNEEGWVTVTRKRPMKPQTFPKRKKKKELVNFYCFQQRESQREQIADLRRRFEEDKKRVVEMKAHRKFKPF